MKIFVVFGLLSLMCIPVIADDDVEYDDIVEEEIFDDEDSFDEEPESEDEIPVADETRTVSARLSCAEINERVLELREDVKMYPDKAEELETMLMRQRTQCAPRANRRPVRNYENINPVMVVDAVLEQESVEEVVVPEQPKPAEVTVPVKTPEEIAAEEAAAKEKAADNLAKGLCADGAKPNRYGCCAGYKFKEVSQMKFQCCNADNDCVEPMKK